MDLYLVVIGNQYIHVSGAVAAIFLELGFNNSNFCKPCNCNIRNSIQSLYKAYVQ